MIYPSKNLLVLCLCVLVKCYQWHLVQNQLIYEAGISYDDPPANDEEEGRPSDHAAEASTEHSDNENSFVVDCNSFPDKTLNTPNALDDLSSSDIVRYWWKVCSRTNAHLLASNKVLNLEPKNNSLLDWLLAMQDTFGASYDTSKESELVKKKLKRENLLKSIKKSSNNISKYQTDYKYNVDDQNKNVGTEDSMKSKTNTAEEQQNEHNRIMQFFLKRQSGTAGFIPYDVEKQVTSDNFVIPTSTMKNIPSSFHFPINQVDDFNNSKFVVSYSRDNNGHKRRDKGQAVNYWDAFRSHADELRYHMQPLPFFRIG